MATDWRQYYKVTQPDIMENPILREARVLRIFRVMVQQNEREISQKTAKKLHKTINVRLLDIMNEVRDG